MMMILLRWFILKTHAELVRLIRGHVELTRQRHLQIRREVVCDGHGHLKCIALNGSQVILS